MESETPVVRRRRTKQPKKKNRTPFFERRLKNLKLTYWEVTVFLIVTFVLVVGVFNQVIYNYFYSLLAGH